MGISRISLGIKFLTRGKQDNCIAIEEKEICLHSSENENVQRIYFANRRIQKILYEWFLASFSQQLAAFEHSQESTSKRTFVEQTLREHYSAKILPACARGDNLHRQRSWRYALRSCFCNRRLLHLLFLP
jgi:hypothetical protein